MKDNTITITTETGEEILCEILFTHHSDEFNKDYVVFMKKGTEEASAAVYQEAEGGTGRLDQIETDEEWKLVEELFNAYLEDMSKMEAGNGGCAGCSGSCGGSCSEDCDCDCECENE